MTYGAYKDLPRRTSYDKVLQKKSLTIDSNPQHDGYQRRLASLVSKYFDKKLVKSLLHDNGVEMYLTNSEIKFVVDERFIKTLKSKIYKYMASVSKIVYTDKLDEVVDKYSNMYEKSMKIKPVDVRPGLYIEYCVENNYKGLKFKVPDHVVK